MPVYYLPPLRPECRLGSTDQQPCSPALPRNNDPALAAAVPQVVQVDDAAELAALAIPCFLSRRWRATSTAPAPPILLQMRNPATGRLAEIELEEEGDYYRPSTQFDPPPKDTPPLLRTDWRALDLGGHFRFGIGRHEFAFRCATLATPRLVLDVRMAV